MGSDPADIKVDPIYESLIGSLSGLSNSRYHMSTGSNSHHYALVAPQNSGSADVTSEASKNICHSSNDKPLYLEYATESSISNKLRLVETEYLKRLDLSLVGGSRSENKTNCINGGREISSSSYVHVGDDGSTLVPKAGFNMHEIPFSFSPMEDLISLDKLCKSLPVDRNSSSNSSSNQYSTSSSNYESKDHKALHKLHTDRSWNNPNSLELMMAYFDVQLHRNVFLSSTFCDDKTISYLDIRKRQNRLESRRILADVKSLFESKDYSAAARKISDAIEFDRDNLEAIVYRAECNFVNAELTLVERDIRALENHRHCSNNNRNYSDGSSSSSSSSRNNAEILTNDLLARIDRLKDLLKADRSDYAKYGSDPANGPTIARIRSNDVPFKGRHSSCFPTFSSSSSSSSSTTTSISSGVTNMPLLSTSSSNIPALLAVVSSSLGVEPLGSHKKRTSEESSNYLSDNLRKKKEKRHKKEKKEKKEKKKKKKEKRKDKKEISKSRKKSKKSRNDSDSSDDFSDDSTDDSSSSSTPQGSMVQLPAVDIPDMDVGEKGESAPHPILSRPKHKLWG